jgi:hypothetical protein
MVYVLPTTRLTSDACQMGLDSPRPQLGGLGLEIDPKLLLAGIGALFVGAFLLGGREEPKRRKRKQAGIQQKIEKLRSELRALEA